MTATPIVKDYVVRQKLDLMILAHVEVEKNTANVTETTLAVIVE